MIIIPQFTSWDKLIKHLESQIVINLEKIGEEIKGVLRNNLMNNWYKTYHPQYYHRTGMLIDSIECKKAVKVGNAWQVEIWFNPEKIVSVPLTEEGFFPSHMNITDGAEEYGGMSYGELLPWWVEKGQHSSIHSYTGIHMVGDTIDWAKSDHYLKNRMMELLRDKGYIAK